MSIRLRRPDTSAIWAPNLEAFLCDVHAVAGARINVLYEPTETHAVETFTRGTQQSVPHRTTSIRHPARLDEDLTDEVRARAPRATDPERTAETST